MHFLRLDLCFATPQVVFKVLEDIVPYTFKKFTNWKVDEAPFEKIPYKEAMEKYGSDKPDLRNPLELIDLTEVFEETTFKPFKKVTVKGIVVEDIATKSNSWFNELVDYAILR